MSSPERAQIVAAGLCIGCGACAVPGAMTWDRNGHLKPRGDAAPPGAGFARICPFSSAAENEDALAARLFAGAAERDRRIGRFEAAYVGHAEPAFRAAGSSGGMVSWVAAALLEQGLVDGVAHVAPTDPESGRFFAYRISRDVAQLRRGAKSRYYPVELSEVLAEIRQVPGRYAVAGVPCFIKAVQLRRAADPLLADRISFTLGLFCGHAKSALLVESFAAQLGVGIGEVAALDYRRKDESRPANWYRTELVLKDGTKRAQDWWHLADGDWGAGFFQNPACDFCDDVVSETADISFGDAWLEPYASDGRGTNVVIVRTPALHDLLRAGMAGGQLQLAPVDADFVAATQAAGLRHRREGLGWRLARRRGPRPVKRVAPQGRLPLRRRLVYRMRQAIMRWSPRMLRLARAEARPDVYAGWARTMLGLYRALAYSTGTMGRLLDRL
ncbi:MAG: Coenzyme F420 hydrogenase/dehydrogenase, beta subunit C-terminal domain, partial [Sphingomonadaceae bacterium]|nr:Coenzyme F420 hydrogenase/dehydrogenase, beta subunit C-terminal domain [Sphingomonadaceae bacterium]